MCDQDDFSEHGSGSIDGSKAGEILRFLATVGNTECLRAGMEAVVEADVDSVVRMLTGTSGDSSGGRVRIKITFKKGVITVWSGVSVVVVSAGFLFCCDVVIIFPVLVVTLSSRYSILHRRTGPVTIANRPEHVISSAHNVTWMLKAGTATM